MIGISLDDPVTAVGQLPQVSCHQDFQKCLQTGFIRINPLENPVDLVVEYRFLPIDLLI